MISITLSHGIAKSAIENNSNYTIFHHNQIRLFVPVLLHISITYYRPGIHYFLLISQQVLLATRSYLRLYSFWINLLHSQDEIKRFVKFFTHSRFTCFLALSSFCLYKRQGFQKEFVHYCFVKTIYNARRNIWNKVNKSSKIGQE